MGNLIEVLPGLPTPDGLLSQILMEFMENGCTYAKVKNVRKISLESFNLVIANGDYPIRVHKINGLTILERIDR